MFSPWWAVEFAVVLAMLKTELVVVVLTWLVWERVGVVLEPLDLFVMFGKDTEAVIVGLTFTTMLNSLQVVSTRVLE
jgi:hypothetical protein